MAANPFIPMLARIVRVVEETPDVKTFRLKLREGGGLDFTPGQFVTVTVFGEESPSVKVTTWAVTGV